jgi:hypothetical protein
VLIYLAWRGEREREGIRKEIRHSTDDGETKETRTRYNVDLAGESGQQ